MAEATQPLVPGAPSTPPAAAPMTPPLAGVPLAVNPLPAASIPPSIPRMPLSATPAVTPAAVTPPVQPPTIPPTAQPPLPVEGSTSTSTSPAAGLPGTISQPPFNIQPPMSAPPTSMLPKHAMVPKWPVIAIGIVAVLALLLGGYYFWSNNMAAVTQPIGSEYQESSESPQQIVPTTSEAAVGEASADTSTAKIAALSKNYSGTALPVQFSYPETWFLEEGEQRVDIQNFDPTTAPERGYDPSHDQGMVRLVINSYNDLNTNVTTLAEFTSRLHQEDQQVCYWMGDPMGKTIVDTEEEITSTTGMQILHRIDHCEQTQAKNENYYLLNGQGKIYQASPSLDTTAEAETIKAIVKTIKF